jgi:hypothetical protein
MNTRAVNEGTLVIGGADGVKRVLAVNRVDSRSAGNKSLNRDAGTSIAMALDMSRPDWTKLAVLSAFGASALWALMGCDPATPYRYTALTPAARPIPWDGRAAKGGEVRIEGSISKNTVYQKVDPQIHDTALNVPEMTAEGSISIAPIKGFEIGVRGSYAAYAWSQPSIDGTEPLPSHPPVWGVGPEFKGTINVDKKRRFAIGIAGNIMRYQTPYAEWSLTGPGSANGQATPCTLSPTCTMDPLTINNAHYSLFAEKSESHFTGTIGVYPSYDFTGTGEYGHIFGVLAGTTGFENDGFTNEAQNGSTLTGYLFIPIVGVGYGIDVNPVRASIMIYDPITTYDSPVYYGPAAMGTIGFDIDLWDSSSNHDKPKGHVDAPASPSPPGAPPAQTSPPAANPQEILISPPPAPDSNDDSAEKSTDQPGVYTAH